MSYSQDFGAESFVAGSCSTICMTDLDLKLLASSDSWKNILPSDKDFSLKELFERNQKEISDACDAIFNGEFQQSIQVEKVSQNETQQNFNLHLYPCFQGAEISGFFVTAEIVKSKDKTPEPAEMLDKHFGIAFKHSVIGMAIVSISGTWIKINGKLSEMLGYSPEEMQQLSFQEMTHPDDLDKDLELLEQLKSGEIDFYHIAKRYYHKDGHLVWTNLAVTMVRDENGDPSCFVGQIEDVSVTQKAQETIRENENIFAGIFHASYQFTALLTKDGRISEINNAALGFFGLTQKQAVGKPFHELPNWDNSERKIAKLLKNIQRAASGEYINSEEKLWDSDKNEVRIDFTLKPVFNEKQKVVSVVAEGKIIQEIIDARYKVMESEQKLRSFFNLSPVAFVVNDLKTGKFIDFNDSFLENTGYTREEFLSFDYLELIPEEYHWMESVMIDRLEDSDVYGPMELEYQNRDGSRFPILINGMLTKGRDGRSQIWSVVQDISELKAKELELQKLNKEIAAQNTRLSASNDELEKFAYVASHDLQEPLRMITGFLTMLHSKYNDKLDAKGREYIHFAVDGATRMRQIIIDILEYSKIDRDQTELQVMNLEQVLKNVTRLFSTMIHEKQATITWKNLPEIMGQRAPLHQLFSNLISNAIKYHLPGVAPKVEITVTEHVGKWLFCVSDNGIGIAPEFHEKIFGLFTRLNAKGKYKGSGIGLALCKKIIEKHGGSIWVESSVNQGSNFYFTLAK